MSSRFIELAVRAHRVVTRTVTPRGTSPSVRVTARRQVGGELTRFSFRLALAIDLTYVGLGALGGAAVGRATLGEQVRPPSCVRDSAAVGPNAGPGSAHDRLPLYPPSRAMR